jgi:hypothetical protein
MERQSVAPVSVLGSSSPHGHAGTEQEPATADFDITGRRAGAHPRGRLGIGQTGWHRL